MIILNWICVNENGMWTELSLGSGDINGVERLIWEIYATSSGKVSAPSPIHTDIRKPVVFLWSAVYSMINSHALSDRDESIRRFAVDCLSRSCDLYHQPSLMYRWRVRQKQKPTEKERMETWKGTAAALTAVLATFYKHNSVQFHT